MFMLAENGEDSVDRREILQTVWRCQLPSKPHCYTHITGRYCRSPCNYHATTPSSLYAQTQPSNTCLLQTVRWTKILKPTDCGIRPSRDWSKPRNRQKWRGGSKIRWVDKSVNCLVVNCYQILLYPQYEIILYLLSAKVLWLIAYLLVVVTK